MCFSPRRTCAAAQIGLSVLCGLVVAAAPLPAFPQNNPRQAVKKPPPVTENVTAEAQRFHDTFFNLSQKLGVVLVLEGVPLQIHQHDSTNKTLNTSEEWQVPEPAAIQIQRSVRGEKPSEQPTDEIQSLEPTKNLTPEEQVEQTAAKYDYQVEKRGNVYLLRKRYTNPLDAPDISLGEGSAALREIIRLISPFDPKVKRRVPGKWFGGMNSAEISLMGSLTDGQEKKMRNGGLAMSDLSPAQTNDTRQIAMFYYIQIPFEHFYNQSAQLDRLLKKNTVLRQKEQSGRLSVGYEDPTGWFGGPLYRALDALPVFADPFPTPTKYEADWEQTWQAQRKAAGAATLGQMATALNSRRTVSEPKIKVDAIFTDKTVTVFNEQKATPDTLLKAAADVCGLRFKVDPDHTPHLTRRTVKPPKTLYELPEALRSALPEPFLRAMHIADINHSLEESAELRAENAEHRQTATDKKMDELNFQRTVWAAYPEQLSNVTIRRLGVRVKPLFAPKPDARIPISALDADTKSAIAQCIMAKSLVEMQAFTTNRLPPYLDRWDVLKVAGGKYKDEKGLNFYRLYLMLPSAQGKSQIAVGGQTAPFKDE